MENWVENSVQLEFWSSLISRCATLRRATARVLVNVFRLYRAVVVADECEAWWRRCSRSAPVVFDHRSNSLVWRHALQLGQRERVELKINAGLLAGLGRVLDQHIIANVLPQETICPAEAGAPFQIGQPLADHIDLPQRLRIAVPVRGRVLVGLVHALLR